MSEDEEEEEEEPEVIDVKPPRRTRDFRRRTEAQTQVVSQLYVGEGNLGF